MRPPAADDWEVRQLMDDETGKMFYVVVRFGRITSKPYRWLWRARRVRNRMRRNWERVPYGGKVIK